MCRRKRTASTFLGICTIFRDVSRKVSANSPHLIGEGVPSAARGGPFPVVSLYGKRKTFKWVQWVQYQRVASAGKASHQEASF